MTDQLDLFTTSSRREPLADNPASIGQSVTQPTDASAEAASRRDTPRRTQMTGDLPGATFEDAFGCVDAESAGQREEVAARTGTCRSCNQPILWARTETKRWMPLDPEPIDATAETRAVFVLRDTGSSAGPTAISAWGLEGTEPHFRSHFDTCTVRAAV